MRVLIRVLRQALGLHRWHAVVDRNTDLFMWRRFNLDSCRWEYIDMSDREQADAVMDWASAP